MRIAAVCVLLAALLSATVPSDSASWQKDVQLRAMADELARSKTLQLNTLEKPYFIQYVSEDSEGVTISADLGGLTHSSRFHVRRPSVEVRVGDYALDDTNSIFSTSRQLGLFPLDDDYGAMRTILWRTTDALYKSALNQITQKRNALREIADPDKTPDLAPAKAVQILEPERKFEVDQSAWEGWVRRASSRFASHPEVMRSSVQFRAFGSTYRLINSEGTIVRIPQPLATVQVRASSRAGDGRRVWNHAFVIGLDTSALPKSDELAGLAQTVAVETESLAKAPLAEDYSGPVLFEGEAAAEMMAQVLTDALVVRRKPVAPPNANTAAIQIPASVWATRVNSKVVPEWLTAFDDPLADSYAGVQLAGHYRMDDEGVPAERVSVIEKGTFKGFLLSRQPVRNAGGSNGHGRLPGPFGSELAAVGNLFIEAASPVPEAELRTKMLEKVKAAGLKYGLIVRRIDFPSTAAFSDLQSMALQARQSGYSRTLNQPLLVYRLWPDGHEELVRGLRFREFSAKDLRDIDAASDKPYVLNYMNNGSSLNLLDASSALVGSSVVCPSLLFDNVELTRAENDGDLPPAVPPPALTGGE
ncbi:MAG TPA: metallopeptidase TldD-related protein [Bryobacteraceae bacterium]